MNFSLWFGYLKYYQLITKVLDNLPRCKLLVLVLALWINSIPRYNLVPLQYIRSIILKQKKNSKSASCCVGTTTAAPWHAPPPPDN